MTLVYSVPAGATSWNSLPLFSGATINVVMHGDSMTLGGIQIPIVQRVAALIVSNGKGTPSWFRDGIAGASWARPDSLASYPYDLTQDLPLRVTPNKSASLPNWLILLAGTNSINLAVTGADEYALFEIYIAASIAAGWLAANTVVCTMLPRGAGNEAERGNYNTALVGGAVTHGYKLARLDSNANIGAAGANDDTNYYKSDAVHLNDTGAAIAAGIVYAAMGL